ncbi:MAG: hypothetical protein AB7K52_00080 [Phycisphaerales bacterium]
MRLGLCTILTAIAGLSAPASAANFLDQVTGGNGTGLYLVSSGNACIDDFEINGIAGAGGGFVPLTGVQAVLFSPSGLLPDQVRVSIYSNDGTLANIRGNAIGNVFSQVFALSNGEGMVQPFPIPGETGNFPGALLITLPFDFNINFGQYFLSIQAQNALGSEFFVRGSDNVVEGTLNNLITVANQGPMGTLGFVEDNAAYRVMGIPTPGAVSMLVLGGLVAARRRRA